MTISAGDILSSSGQHLDRALKYPPTMNMVHDAQVLAARVTQLLTSFSSTQPADAPERKVRSGYRPPEVNEEIPGAAKNSNHRVCRAVDIEDDDRTLGIWCMANLDLLEHFELWMEATPYTPTWVHLQSVPPHSQHRVFVP